MAGKERGTRQLKEEAVRTTAPSSTSQYITRTQGAAIVGMWAVIWAVIVAVSAL